MTTSLSIFYLVVEIVVIHSWYSQHLDFVKPQNLWVCSFPFSSNVKFWLILYLNLNYYSASLILHIAIKYLKPKTFWLFFVCNFALWEEVHLRMIASQWILTPRVHNHCRITRIHSRSSMRMSFMMVSLGSRHKNLNQPGFLRF